MWVNTRPEVERQQLAQLNERIVYWQTAINATPKTDAHQAWYLENLGWCFRDRYQRSSNLDDLDDSIRYYEQAVEAAPDDYPRGIARFCNLGLALAKRYARTSEMDDLNRAIISYERGLQATPNGASDDKTIFMQSLASGMVERYHMTGHIDDLNQAIGYFEHVLEVTADNDHENHAHRLGNLASAKIDRYFRTNHKGDLDQVISYYEKAVELTPADHPELASRFQGLGLALRHRYQYTGSIGDLNRSVTYLQYAVDAFPRSRLDWARHSFDKAHGPRHDLDLGTGFYERYMVTGQQDDLDLAIISFRKAIEDAPEDNPDRADQYVSYGNGMYQRYLKSGRLDDLEESTKSYRTALGSNFGLLSVRMQAARAAVSNFKEQCRWNDAAQLLDNFLELLPQANLPTHSREDLQHTLQSISGLASQSASIFLKAGRLPFEALQALECGRGIIASLTMDAKSEFFELKEQHPELWSRYNDCRERIALMNIKSGSDSPEVNIARSNQRQQLMRTLNELQTEIRNCAGFDKFLLPPSQEQVQRMARSGPIVCFNISDVSSEAFLVTTTETQVLDLPSLREAKVRHSVTLLAARGYSTSRDATLCDSDDEEEPSTSDAMLELEHIWLYAVRPVLSELGLPCPMGTTVKLPRIWWVGGGAMSFVPLHAAGKHTLGSTENTLSCVVSSYASTLKALQFLQSKPVTALAKSEPKSNVLIVSMPVTPEGHKPLRLTQEVAAIQRQSKAWATVTNLDRPDRESVLAALKTCHVAHFACHAVSDPTEPSNSALLLGRDVLEKLTLRNIDTLVPNHAQIAYLSACSTAESKVRNLADESIHLASAFQLAGFMHVIGTLWAADDDAAVQIASHFYEGLNMYDGEDGGFVAYALHHAVLSYREKGDNRLAVTKWAPFIHLGP